ncbi:unnamed protein product [Symbiodinium microadriaticum]|nr:unnamed protein product [Symbiodinium microadriaticum]
MKPFLALCVVGAVALKQGSLNLLKVPGPVPSDSPGDSSLDFEDALVAAVSASKGRESPETKALVEKLQQLLDNAKPAIKKTLEGLQATLTNTGNAMSDCGGQEMQRSSAAFEKNFTTKSAAHKTCRQTQKQNLDTQNTCQTELKTVTSTAKTTCEALEALEKTMYSAKDSCEVKSGEAFEAYHTRLIEASQKTLVEYKKLKEGCAKAKEELESKGPECTIALKTYEDQKENCDSVQDAMDSLSCSHYEAATSKCEASGTCYDKAVANYESVQTSSMTQLDSLKKEWRAILRMECIIQVFNLQESKRASAIDSCQAKDMSGQADSDLPLQLSTIPNKPTCHVPANKAGSAGYVQANFEGLPADSPAKACVASCCQQPSHGTSGLDFSGLGTTPSGDWRLALNVDTSDGNVVSYINSGFWESATGLGGASDKAEERFTRDYKDLEVFNKVQAKQLLIVCHNEGKALGWRSWKLVDTKTLQGWFTTGNTCSSGLQEKRFQMGVETTGGDVGTLVKNEPLIKNTIDGTDRLYVNSHHGHTGGFDFNRLSANADDNPHGNFGAGLGTQYDAHIISGGGGTCGNTARPMADAEMRTEKHHWGSGGGMGGLIGSDHTCHEDCPWTVSSGYDFDYAIFVLP